MEWKKIYILNESILFHLISSYIRQLIFKIHLFNWEDMMRTIMLEAEQLVCFDMRKTLRTKCKPSKTDCRFMSVINEKFKGNSM